MYMHIYDWLYPILTSAISVLSYLTIRNVSFMEHKTNITFTISYISYIERYAFGTKITIVNPVYHLSCSCKKWHQSSPRDICR